MYPFSFYRTALNTNLKIEREWRTSLQEESVKDKERIGAMQMELKQLEKLKKVLNKMFYVWEGAHFG